MSLFCEFMNMVFIVLTLAKIGFSGLVGITVIGIGFEEKSTLPPKCILLLCIQNIKISSKSPNAVLKSKQQNQEKAIEQYFY